MFTSSISSVPSTPIYSAPSETAGSVAYSAPSLYSTETAGSVASSSSSFSIVA
ncbi:MAG: hypothetical protein IKU37_06660 [Candidatus Gastranaerophilales bacterium]|nr:hypothetical protein [Candidatus Gastranaerophilales bacterium]